MADLIFLNGFAPVEKEIDIVRTQVGTDGNPNFINSSYKFYAEFPALNLQPVASNVPVLNRVYGWVTGG